MTDDDSNGSGSDGGSQAPDRPQFDGQEVTGGYSGDTSSDSDERSDG